MYLLDTNVVSELRKVEVGTADPRVKAWSDNLDAEAAFLSVITVLELEQGTLLMERRDSRQGAMLRAWLENRILPQFEGRILSVDLLVARRCATLHVPDPREDRDSLIAATALVHGMTVVTRNVSHFAHTGVKILNPWEA
jgi:predicted nucleic acid-binding protein